MRWKEIITTAAITLLVTVLGGLLVFYFTQYDKKENSERISYEVHKQVSFVGSDNQISIGSLKFSNTGSKPAKNIKAVFSSEYAEIMEFQHDSEAVDISTEISKEKTSVLITVETLLPEEIITLTYLLSKEVPVEFQIRSDQSLGIKESIVQTESDKSSILNDFLGNFVPILILILIAPLIIIIRALRSKTSRPSNKNNIGFVLLHKNLIEEALPILKESVKSGNEGPYSLSNYAVALALSGDMESSRKHIGAAQILASTDHEKAVWELNSSIIKFIEGDNAESEKNLKHAISLSKSEILFYIKNSEIFKDMINKNPQISELVK